ncbi:MAG TPA: dienelactone hydrolase family protein [Candidatus Micrarchaeaceae archaeon]|nr:dienelactone hydrolase family protein [Candidatus Micrarchaeaceae archaeon]
MVEKEIRVHTADGEMSTFVVRPDGDGPFPVAVVYMDGVGYREQVKANARRFARDGYYCVAPDLYYRMGEQLSFDMSRLASDGMRGPEAEKMMKAAGSVTPENVTADTKALLEAITSDPAASRGPKVCVGYCLGARVSLHIASALSDEFVAAAGIHPGALINDKPDSPHHDLPGVRGELYFAFAEIDRSATPELVEQFREQLRRNGVRGEVERIPGVAHGFAMADLPVYDRAASEDHFERTLDLWRRNLSAEHARA